MSERITGVSRWRKAQDLAASEGIEALLVTPGADLRYLTGYAALPLERLTCLVLPSTGDPTLIVPALEAPAAKASGVDVAIATWGELDDPFALVTDLVGAAATIGLDDHMWASRVFALRDALPNTRQVLAGSLVQQLRIRKEADEIAALRDAGQAIDRVHARMGEWLRPGRTEREVGADIARAIVDEGHETVDFVIVGSGPNSASPHHELSDRVIQVGDPVVIDIGGTNHAGYCSDSTRNYLAGGSVPAEYAEIYEVLRVAQRTQLDFAKPGVTAESVDAVGRAIIADAGFGDRFIHRTGHGIGQETHEEPYIVEGSSLVLEEGMAFSIEPGIYLEGRFGARIEDIVVCTADGVEILNNQPRELIAL
ncbi:Xaa-Pro peptidase family protein [Aeromicrobium panaciterrae]|uniref:M24 family metallopeptidase n=1 Tax=Aeromicrobium panaciterrae TaxID=363861 RepID=UPI0031D4EAD6